MLPGLAKNVAGKRIQGQLPLAGVGVRLKQTRLGGGSRRGRLRRCKGGGAAGAGLEAGGGDVVLLGAHLEPDVADAALQDGVGAVVEGRQMAAAGDPDTFGGPQLLGQLTLEPFFLARLPKAVGETRDR